MSMGETPWWNFGDLTKPARAYLSRVPDIEESKPSEPPQP